MIWYWYVSVYEHGYCRYYSIVIDMIRYSYDPISAQNSKRDNLNLHSIQNFLNTRCEYKSARFISKFLTTDIYIYI